MTKSFDAQDYLVRRARNEGRLGAAGVYSPDMEHDACGVGLSQRVMANQTGLLSNPPLKPCKLFGIAVRLTLTA